MAKKSLTRREFIKAAGVVLGTSVLAACSSSVVTQIVEQTSVVKETEVQTQLVNQVVTATPLPTNTPAPIVLDVWWNTDIADLNAVWKNNDKTTTYATEGFWGGLARTAYLPWLAKHPGVSMKISGHDWDSNLRMNQLLAIAAGNTPDVTLGEAYVTEFVRLGVYNPVSNDAAALIADGPLYGTLVDGKYYGIPESSGTNALMINLDCLKKAGLPTDKLPTTWDDLLTMAKAISKVNNDSKWGNNAFYTYGPDPTTYGTAMRVLPWFNQNGAALDDGKGYPSANTDAAVSTWQWFNELMWTSTKNLIQQGDSEGGSGQLFGQGVIALKLGWSNDMTSVGDMNTNAVATSLPLPTGGKSANIVIGNTIISPLKGGKNPDMAVTHVQEVWTQEDAQAWLAQNAGIWIPALKSLLQQYETYNKLDAYKTDTAKAMVRVTMKELLGNAIPVPSWPKNGAQCWSDWNNSYLNIWGGNLGKDDIKKELDKLQATLLTDTSQTAK